VSQESQEPTTGAEAELEDALESIEATEGSTVDPADEAALELAPEAEPAAGAEAEPEQGAAAQ
jgi:transcriptional antiterminator NusG